MKIFGLLKKMPFINYIVVFMFYIFRGFFCAMRSNLLTDTFVEEQLFCVHSNCSCHFGLWDINILLTHASVFHRDVCHQWVIFSGVQ